MPAPPDSASPPPAGRSLAGPPLAGPPLAGPPLAGHPLAGRPLDCVGFLRWCLPRLGYRWSGFRKVRRTVCRRVRKRMRRLGLDGFGAYALFLGDHPEEWRRLDDFMPIPISRFYRDKGIFDLLGAEILPELAAGLEGGPLRCWSVGCASGEEPYSLRLLWDFRLAPRHPGLDFLITATDRDETMLARAEKAAYGAGSLRDLPEPWRRDAFDLRKDEKGAALHVLKPAHRHGLRLLRQDIRKETPDGPFHLILCRNLAFTYFDEAGQEAALERLLAVLLPGGYLLLGSHERLPRLDGLSQPHPNLPLYRKAASPPA